MKNDANLTSQKRGCLKCDKKHLGQFLFCISEKEFKEVKKKAPKRGKKEYDKKRIVEILVFGDCIQLRRIVLRGVQWEQIKPNSFFFNYTTKQADAQYLSVKNIRFFFF